MAAVASVEPSSATSISQSGKVWAATEAMVASRVAAAFQAGVMTETAGVMVRSDLEPAVSRGDHGVDFARVRLIRSRPECLAPA